MAISRIPVPGPLSTRTFLIGAVKLHIVAARTEQMKLFFAGFTVLTTMALSSCIAAEPANRASFLPGRPTRVMTAEPGVVPSGTSLLIRTNETINTRRAARGTVYEAFVAEDVLDQNGNILIPKASPVELVVRSLPYLGPGGVMTELTLGVHSITVNGATYPVETKTGTPDTGGFVADSDAPSVVGAADAAGQSLTTGQRISVRSQTLLSFRIADPIRLKGYIR